MLVDPRRVTARGMHHAKHSVGADEVPGIYDSTTFGRIARQLSWVQRRDAALSWLGARGPAIQLGIVVIHSLVVVSSRTGGCLIRFAVRLGKTGARVNFWSIE